MKFHLLPVVVVLAAIATPLNAAQAQGIPDGAAHGAYVGNNAAGPVGAVVGGAVGGAVGGVIGGVEGGIAGVFGLHPVAASYPANEAPVYRHHHVRHSYRHGYRTHAAS
jgi:phage tail tape-measure protein